MIKIENQGKTFSSVYELPVSKCSGSSWSSCQNKNVLKIEDVTVFEHGQKKRYSVDLCFKQQSENIYFPALLKQFRLFRDLSMALFGKAEPNFILLSLAVASYLVGLLISLLALLLMDLIFRFDPENLEECVYPLCFKDEKIQLNFRSDESTVHSGSEIFYNLANFAFSLLLSIFSGYFLVWFGFLVYLGILILIVVLLVLAIIKRWHFPIYFFVFIIFALMFIFIIYWFVASSKDISIGLVLIAIISGIFIPFLPVILRSYGNFLIKSIPNNSNPSNNESENDTQN